MAQIPTHIVCLICTMNAKKIAICIAIVSIAINIVLCIFFMTNRSNVSPPSNEAQYAAYPLLSKRVFLTDPNDIIINFNPLRTALRFYVEKSAPKNLGVYFEYLPSGSSVGVNDTMELRLASLSKIPAAMAAYKQIENGTIKSDQLLTISKDNLDTKFGDLWKTGAGSVITVKDAVRLSLTHSDNTAYNTLISSISNADIDDIYDSLDIPREHQNNLPIVSPKNYSSILRTLYLSSYLNKKDSQEILQILTQTLFNDKLPAGVPSGVPVAHKIGVFEEADTKQSIYNDCGIVYVPKRPYLLCLMFKGNEAEAQKYMVNVSKIIYSFVSQTTHE